MKKKYIVVTMLLGIFLIVIGATTYIVKKYEYKVLEEKRIESARMAVDEANDTKESKDIIEAKEMISVVETIEVKEELMVSISSLELAIEKENISLEFQTYLESAQNNLSQEELNQVIERIHTIQYEDLKALLLEKANGVQTVITTEKKRLEELAYYRRMKKIDATKVVSTPPSDVTVLETVTGKITAFTPYCSDGCAGYTASGKFVGNGDIYQYDPEYGMVHIVAGDSSYPFGTIVRIKNLGYFGGDIYAIVLDRGGAIGKNKRALFDLLFATEENANRFGVASSITCEILRIGY